MHSITAYSKCISNKIENTVKNVKKNLHEVIWNMKRKHLRHIEHCVVLITVNEHLQMDFQMSISTVSTSTPSAVTPGCISAVSLLSGCSLSTALGSATLSSWLHRGKGTGVKNDPY